jgi:hypothetical protein
MEGTMKKVFVLIIVVCFLIPGCATLFKGISSKLDLNSDPQGAQVFVNGNLMGETPVRIKLESKGTYSIEFKKEGFKTKTFNIQNHVGAGWIVLDILGGLLPIIVDAATGAWYDLDQTAVNAILEKQQPHSMP